VTKKSQFAVLLSGLLVVACATSKPKPSTTPEQHARLLLNVANAALVENDPTEAMEALAQAEAVDPDLPEIYHTRGLALYNRGNIQGALEQVQKAVKMSPDYVDANNSLGKILTDLGRYDEAVAPLQRAAHATFYRETYKPLTNLGILYYRKGDIGKASDFFTKAVEQGGEHACIAYYYKGHLDLRDGHFSDAIKDYTNATKRWCAGFADAHLAIAITYERSKQYALARRTFVEVQQRYPNSKAADQAIDHLRELP
jgi:tetratricopeptide (TPR) repeat protein